MTILPMISSLSHSCLLLSSLQLSLLCFPVFYSVCAHLVQAATVALLVAGKSFLSLFCTLVMFLSPLPSSFLGHAGDDTDVHFRTKHSVVRYSQHGDEWWDCINLGSLQTKKKKVSSTLRASLLYGYENNCTLSSFYWNVPLTSLVSTAVSEELGEIFVRFQNSVATELLCRSPANTFDCSENSCGDLHCKFPLGKTCPH